MASLRGLRVKGVQDGTIQLIDSSPKGRETLMGIGNWGTGTKIEVLTELTVGKETSPLTVLPSSVALDKDFAVEINIGFKNPMYIRIFNTDATTDLFVKVVSSEV